MREEQHGRFIRTDTRRLEGNGFAVPRTIRAGQTEEEAVLNLQSQSLKQLPQGSKIVQVTLPQEGKNDHPWLAIAGSMADDPFWEEYQEGIREYRKRVEEADSPTVAHAAAWRKLRGNLKDEPFFDAWMKAIEEYRQQKDREEGL